MHTFLECIVVGSGSPITQTMQQLTQPASSHSSVLQTLTASIYSLSISLSLTAGQGHQAYNKMD